MSCKGTDVDETLFWCSSRSLELHRSYLPSDPIECRLLAFAETSGVNMKQGCSDVQRRSWGNLIVVVEPELTPSAYLC